jgi:hypothetical protein
MLVFSTWVKCLVSQKSNFDLKSIVIWTILNLFFNVYDNTSTTHIITSMNSSANAARDKYILLCYITIDIFSVLLIGWAGAIEWDGLPVWCRQTNSSITMSEQKRVSGMLPWIAY